MNDNPLKWPENLPAFAPFVVLRQVEGLAGPKLEAMQFHGAVTLLDYHVAQCARFAFVELFDKLDPIAEGIQDAQLDRCSALAWRMAASLVRTRPTLERPGAP